MSLRAHEVSYRIGEVELLHELDVGVAPGRVVALLGPNGAGKSTLLRVLSGELRPSRGVVELDGAPLHAIDAAALARIRAVVPQHSRLDFGFSVLEVVLLGRLPHPGRGESREDLEIAMAALQQCDVAHLPTRQFTSLSGGERQRVALARALAQIDAAGDKKHDCVRYLLLDEPTASLDLSHAWSTLERLRSIAANGVGVIVAVHDLGAAVRFADEVLLLARGRRVAAGPARRALSPECLHRAFDIEIEVVTHPSEGWPMFFPRPCRTEPSPQK